MGKSKRHRRTGGRTTPKGQGGSIAAPLVGKAYQKLGALGLLVVIAEFAATCEERNAEDGSSSEPASSSGESFVKLIASDPSKLAAGVLAAVTQVWPDETVRLAARESLKARHRQLAGALRTLDNTKVVAGLRVTDEYRDSEVLLFEISLGGRQTLTLSAVTDAYKRSWVELELFKTSAQKAADSFHCPDQPGNPRRITEQLTKGQMRREAWMLTSRRRVDAAHQAAPVVLAWLARLLEADATFPEIPEFDELTDDIDDDYIDAADELGAFLFEPEGHPWRGDSFDELIDHLASYEWGERSMKWSPSRVEDLLVFANHAGVENVHALPALLRSWVRHCAAAHRQRKPLLRAVLAEIDRCEPEFFELHSQEANVA